MRAVLALVLSALIGAGLMFIAAETAAKRQNSAAGVVTLATTVPAATDALRTVYGTVPDELWGMLTDSGHVADAQDAVHVDYGSAWFTETGMYLATVDGWFGCRHGVTTRGNTCAATAPVVPLGTGPVPGVDTPTTSPSGAAVTFSEPDDGSAEYGDGLMFDPASRLFQLPVFETLGK